VDEPATLGVQGTTAGCSLDTLLVDGFQATGLAMRSDAGCMPEPLRTGLQVSLKLCTVYRIQIEGAVSTAAVS
jgi:hypothetical protein